MFRISTLTFWNIDAVISDDFAIVNRKSENSTVFVSTLFEKMGKPCIRKVIKAKQNC
jgi:hypothetical protein